MKMSTANQTEEGYTTLSCHGIPYLITAATYFREAAKGVTCKSEIDVLSKDLLCTVKQRIFGTTKQSVCDMPSNSWVSCNVTYLSGGQL